MMWRSIRVLFCVGNSWKALRDTHKILFNSKVYYHVLYMAYMVLYTYIYIYIYYLFIFVWKNLFLEHKAFEGYGPFTENHHVFVFSFQSTVWQVWNGRNWTACYFSECCHDNMGPLSSKGHPRKSFTFQSESSTPNCPFISSSLYLPKWV